MKANHVGRILISQELVLQWLQLQGGKIKATQIHPANMTIALVIEHPDMPIVQEFEEIPIVTPFYSIDDGGVITRMPMRKNDTF